MYSQLLPDDYERATLLGRIWRPGAIPGPAVVLVEKGEVFDITAAQPLVAEILNSEDPTALLKALRTREHIGPAPELLENSIVPPARAKHAMKSNRKSAMSFVPCIPAPWRRKP